MFPSTDLTVLTEILFGGYHSSKWKLERIPMESPSYWGLQLPGEYDIYLLTVTQHALLVARGSLTQSAFVWLKMSSSSAQNLFSHSHLILRINTVASSAYFWWISGTHQQCQYDAQVYLTKQRRAAPRCCDHTSSITRTPSHCTYISWWVI